MMSKALAEIREANVDVDSIVHGSGNLVQHNQEEQYHYLSLEKRLEEGLKCCRIKEL